MCSQGFVSNGIANKLDGTEDGLLTLDFLLLGRILAWGGPDGLRAKVMEEVHAA